jgi:outer membrane receptor protein involved in Fe transport
VGELKTTLGSDYTNVENDGTSASGTQLPPGAQSVGQAAVQGASNTLWTATKTWGYYAEEQAALHDRLFLTAAIRADQNSAFGTNFQKVVYPKFSVSWLVSDESFFPKFRWLDQLRLRSAYGASGVQPGATSALITFASTTVNQRWWPSATRAPTRRVFARVPSAIRISSRSCRRRRKWASRRE